MTERLEHPEHGRVLQAYLTGEGEDVLARCRRAAAAVEERMVSALSGKERKKLLEGLRACAGTLRR